MKLNIVYEDSEILVVYKPSNVLSISTDKEKEKTIYHLCSQHLKHKDKSSKVFIVHRLDKSTSGLMVLAKNYKVKLLLQEAFEKGEVKRFYVARTHNHLPLDNMRIEMNLVIDKLKVYAVKKPIKSSKKAVTLIRKLASYEDSDLVDIEILTGRKHQIRLALASINCPIIGDPIYSNDREKYMFLKAYKLDISSLNPKWLFEISKQFKDK